MTVDSRATSRPPRLDDAVAGARAGIELVPSFDAQRGPLLALPPGTRRVLTLHARSAAVVVRPCALGVRFADPVGVAVAGHRGDHIEPPLDDQSATPLSLSSVPLRTCAVTFTDTRGVRHTVEVVADSSFEAAVLAVQVLWRTAGSRTAVGGGPAARSSSAGACDDAHRNAVVDRALAYAGFSGQSLPRLPTKGDRKSGVAAESEWDLFDSRC